MKKLGKITVVCMCMFLAVGALGQKAWAAEKVLKVGVIAPYTGSNARIGAEIKNAALMAFEDIGYKIGDYTVKLVFIDDQMDPAKGASAYAEAAEREDVQATTICWSSSVTLALMDLAVKYKVPHIGGMGGAQSEIDKYKSDPKYKGYWMGAYGILSELAVGYVEFLEDSIQKGLWKPPKKLVALFALDTEWGRTVVSSLKKSFQNRGWAVSSEDFFSANQTDFYPAMAKYKNSGATVVAGTSSIAPLTAAFTKQAAEVGLKAVMINDGLGWIGEWYKLTGPASNYVLDMIPQFSTPKAKEWAKRYEKKFGFEPSATASGCNYDNINLFVKIAKRAQEKYGKIDKGSLHSVISDELCTGKLTYGTDEGAILVKKFQYSPELGSAPKTGMDYWGLPVIQYMNGVGKVVYPPDVKEADPVFK